jgi:hypothetical protein
VTDARFRDRYAVVRFADGGVLADLVTGSYSRLNRSAAVVCEALAANDVLADAKADAAKRLGIADDEAARAVDEIVATLGRPGPRRPRPDSFFYELAPDPDGYVFSAGERPRLLASADGLTVRAAPGDESTPAATADYLRALAPRLLFLRGALVVHGAACRRPAGALAFCGDSGAGKTTTARAFEAAGAPLVAEDMLVVASESPLTVHAGGEEAIRAWAREEAPRLRRDGRIDSGGLRAAFEGQPIPISEIWFIAAARRAVGADQVEPRRLGPTEGALAVMGSLFLGATSADEWRRFLTLAGAIAGSSTALFEAQMPDGLENLRGAARLYTQSSAW